jgi:hypothetical protein
MIIIWGAQEALQKLAEDDADFYVPWSRALDIRKRPFNFSHQLVTAQQSRRVSMAKGKNLNPADAFRESFRSILPLII